MLTLINARDDDEFDNVIRNKGDCDIPWIESTYVNGDKEKLYKEPKGSRRIFKTHMTHQS